VVERYAAAGGSGAPIHTHTEVTSVSTDGDGYRVETTAGTWDATAVVLASGAFNRARVPAVAASLPAAIDRVDPLAYKRAEQLRPGRVLVVGASATGVQLADELAGAGRPVVLATGNHARLPRRYRGMDIFWWLDRIGTLDRTIDDLPDPVAARHEPSVQLVGRPDHRDLDLTTLQRQGVELAGRLVGVDGRRARFAGDLARTVARADSRMRRVLAEIDDHIDATGLTAEVLEPDPPTTTIVVGAIDEIDLAAAGVTSVIWATGHRRTYPWLHLPVFDERGEIRQRRGVTPVPGVYVLGQRFQHHRRSNFIEGIGRDAAFVAGHLVRRTTSIHQP
jgi:putative flavoprotein involved in K+ transport